MYSGETGDISEKSEEYRKKLQHLEAHFSEINHARYFGL